jgi:hypothetical protein
MKKITQIMPAEGWYLQTYQFDTSGKDPTFERVACFGLQSDGSVLPMIPGDGARRLVIANEGSLWYLPDEKRRIFNLSEAEYKQFRGMS